MKLFTALLACFCYAAIAIPSSNDTSGRTTDVSNVTATGSFSGQKYHKREYTETPGNLTDDHERIGGRNVTMECETRCRLALSGDREHQLFCIVHCQGDKERPDWPVRERSARCWKRCMTEKRD